MQAKKMPRLVAVVLGVIAVIGGIFAVVGRGGDDAPPPANVEAAHARVLAPATIAALREFSLSYEGRTPADEPLLRPSLAVGLMRDGERLFVLAAKHSGSPARVTKAGEPVALDSVELRGRQTLTFRLPDLDAGYYQLCGKVGFDATGAGNQAQEPFCHTIKVTE